MDRYRIILVDDEEEVRKGIIRRVDWESLGFQMVGDAENGEDALEKIEQLEPDVVMTDIRMPYMDGLTLCSRIRQKYPSMKILLFSGYDDFEYAQQAIKLNVTEYILKPVNMEELSEILKKVKKNLDEEIEQRRNLDLLRESYQMSIPILREVFLNEWLRGSVDSKSVPERLKEYQVDLMGARKWVCAVLDVEAEPSGGDGSSSAETGKNENFFTPHQKRELNALSVRRLLEDNLQYYFRMAAFNASDGIAMIAAIDQDNSQTRLIDLLGEFCREAARILNMTVTIGIGHSAAELSGIGEAYQSAVVALSYKSIVGAGKAIYINDMKRERDHTSKKAILEAKQYISEHYQDPELSVDMICRKLHMSPAYFSTLFKKETGQTYVAYLTEVRLGKAVELLENTDEKTYAIAQRVGYQEQNYFSYVFKKRYGVSPTKFRDSQGGNR